MILILINLIYICCGLETRADGTALVLNCPIKRINDVTLVKEGVKCKQTMNDFRAMIWPFLNFVFIMLTD